MTTTKTKKNTRFLARKEFFGCLIYDRNLGDYIPFDWNATYIFQNSQKFSLKDIFEQLKERLNQQSFETFVHLCQSSDIIDERGRFAGDFVDNKPIPNILSAPTRVHLCLSYYCPMECAHCLLPKRDSGDDEMPVEKVKEIIDQMEISGVAELVLGAPDPCLHSDFLEILEYARNKGIAVIINTTAAFVNRNMVYRMAELGIKEIRVSMDAATEKVYDYLRGKHMYRKTIRGLKMFKEIFKDTTKLVIRCTLMKYNLSEINSLIRTTQKFNADQLQFSFVKPIGFAQKISNQILPDVEEASKAISAIHRLAKSVRTPISIPQYPAKTSRKGLYKGFGCWAANLYCYISPTGGVSPCYALNQSPKDSIIEKPLIDIWLNSEEFKALRSLKGNKVCNECGHFHVCRGGCRAQTLIYEGKDAINITDPTCYLRPDIQ